MKNRGRWKALGALVFTGLTLVLGTNAQAQFLFDATKAEMSGNADWVIDADLHNLNVTNGNGSGTLGTGGKDSNPAITPAPAASGITAATSETYWNGALSSWGVSLVQRKAGTVSTLPYNGRITYGDASNPQDLSKYRVFVLVDAEHSFHERGEDRVAEFRQPGRRTFSDLGPQRFRSQQRRRGFRGRDQ